MEEVAQSAGEVAESPRWFQLCWGKNPDLTASMVQRAERARYSALVVTLDTHSLGWRERDLGHGYLPFMLGQGLANYFSDAVFPGLLAQAPEENPAAAIQIGEQLTRTAEVLSLLAQAYEFRGDTQRAYDALRSATQLEPRNEGAAHLEGHRISAAAHPCCYHRQENFA